MISIEFEIGLAEFENSATYSLTFIRQDDDQYLLIWGDRHNPTRIDLKDCDVEVLNRDLSESAEAMVRHLLRCSEKDPESWRGQISDPHSGLASRGHFAFNRIFRPIAAELAGDLLGESMTLEVNSEEFVVPWDWLYLESPASAVGASKNVLSPFWGSRHLVVRRLIPFVDSFSRRVRPGRSPRNIVPKIGVIWDEALRYAHDELERLRELESEGKVQLEILLLKDHNDHWASITEINEFVNRPGLDVLHFAVHAEYDEHNPMRSFFRVGGGFQYQLAFLESSPVVDIKAPLVFLNACSTGVRRPRQTFEFVTSLLRRGVEGVVAIEATVDSSLARDFALELYPRLSSGANLSSALAESRSSILLKAGEDPVNVLALLYSFYGDLFCFQFGGDEVAPTSRN